MPTSVVTFSAANQPDSSSSRPVVVANVRVSEQRVPPGPGRRTVATTVSRCTSNPAHRSINTSIPLHPFPCRWQGPPGEGNLSIKKLRYALEAAGQGASGPRVTLFYGLTAPRGTDVGTGRPNRFSSGPGARRQRA